MDVVTLRAGGAGLQLIPALGGAVARYWLEQGAATWEWLRPASAAALCGGNPYETAAFPLVPYSNRIRHGHFRFRGLEVALPLNRPPERHSIHGHGWQASWTRSRSGRARRGSSTGTPPAPGRGPTAPASTSPSRRRA